MSRRTRAVALTDLSKEIRGWQLDQELFDDVVAEAAGLNRSQWRCLDLLGTRGSLTAGQLATAARLTTGAVTAVVDQLERAGLVRRIRDTKDRRKVIIELTEAVAKGAEPVYGPLITDTATELARFDLDELETITKFIRVERQLLARHTSRVQGMLSGGPRR